jgi:hypothetical protein
MAKSEELKVAFPMIANYNDVVRYFVEVGMNQTYIRQPKMTRRTMK